MAERDRIIDLTERQMIWIIGCVDRSAYLAGSAQASMSNVQGAGGKMPESGLTYLRRLARSFRGIADGLDAAVSDISGEPLDANDVISSIEEMLDGRDEE